jgi:hypothetical protein
MTGTPDNFSLPPLPPGLDEVDLLAWVEGDALPRNREVAVARLLSENPQLARQLDALRRDKDVLRSLGGDERAPAGLLDGVQAALQPVMERQMLLGLQDGQMVDSRPPVSLVIPARRSMFDVMLRDRIGRRMAMAAGLLLLVGGTTYLAAVMFSGNGPQPSEIGRLAHQGDALAEDPASLLAAKERESSAPAMGDGDSPTALESEPTMLAQGPEGHAATEDPADASIATALRSGDEPAIAAAEALPMSTAEALRLAEANKLVIRVRLGEGLVRTDPVVDRLRRNSSGWRYAGEASQILASALIRHAPEVGPQLVRPGEVVASSDFRGTPPGAWVGPPAPIARAMMDLPRPRSAVHVVQSRLDAASLESLRTALAGVSGAVWFEEAEEGTIDVLGSSPNPPLLAPSAVLWWSQPPAAWTWWSSVPVVVEPGR